MIVYLTKKSKFILKYFYVVLGLGFILYIFFVFQKIQSSNIDTIQIIQNTERQNREETALLPPQTTEKVVSIQNEDYLFVASSKGKYYYPKNCSRAKTLSIQNMLYFKDKISAEMAGYVAHSAC